MPSLATLRSAAAARVEWKRFDRALDLAPRPDLERFGTEYGGYMVPTSLPREEWICYSCGVGEDASFDLALIDRFGCSVFAFDPTPRAARFATEVAQANDRFTFLPYGVAARNEERTFHAPADPSHVSHSFAEQSGGEGSFVARCRSLDSLTQELEHDRLDLLKLDVEGAEYEILSGIATGGIRPTVVCVEFHNVSSFDQMTAAARELVAVGYRPVHHHRLVVTFVATSALEG